MSGDPAVSARSPDSPTYPLTFPVVALVASAGGLDALGEVLTALPADLPAAVIIAQHVRPSATSHLVAILDRRTALTVKAAENGAPLTPGTVLVVPPSRHLLVTSEARVGLIDVGSIPPARPSAAGPVCSRTSAARRAGSPACNCPHPSPSPGSGPGRS